MDEQRRRAIQLFGKAVYQSALFTRKCQELGGDVVEQIVAVTAAHYPRFKALKHGLMLGRLSAALPAGYEGPELQFVYKVLAGTIFFADLKVGGYSRPELAAIEAAYDL